ncbi:MAG: hypothetical protein RMI91_08980 [Gemmatales bacterium]|nr:hypothetical protein [Gemmatales bacterium]MDW7994772.1 hypothetical protein [Gemmatales bacterium]
MARASFCGTGLSWLASLVLVQGCHCLGWYHYHNCHVYLGTPPGTKTYGFGWWTGWPYVPGTPHAPAWSIPLVTAQYGTPFSLSDGSVSSNNEPAPMPRLQEEPNRSSPPDGPSQDILIPPPRKASPQSEAPPPAPNSFQGDSRNSYPQSQALHLEIVSPPQMTLEQTAELRIVLSNRSDRNLQDTEVILHLPRVLRAQSALPTPHVQDQQVIWKLNSLGPHVREIFTVQLKAHNTASAAVCHVSVLAADGNGAASSCSIRIIPAE